MRAAWPMMAAAAILLASAAASAAILLRSESTFVTGVADVPVRVAAGDGASNGRYITSFTVSGNATSYSAGITGRVGADATVKRVATLENPGAVSRTITLRGSQVAATNVQIHGWTVKDGGAAIATLNMKDASPSASFTLPAGETYNVDMRVKIAKGASINAAEFSSSVWVVVG